MKRQAERHAIILDIVQRQGFASIDELAQACGTSTQTVRRDLARLTDEGRVLKFHGGAARVEEALAVPYAVRSTSNVAPKEAVARTVADLIPEESTVFLSGGSTLAFVATELAKKSRLTVVTNSLHAGMALYNREDFRVMVAGGMIRTESGSLTGEDTLSVIRRYIADFAVISATGLTPEGDILEMDEEVVPAIKEMLNAARQTILALDSSKLQDFGIVRSSHLKQIDHLVCDRPLPDALRKACNAYGVSIHSPEPHPASGSL